MNKQEFIKELSDIDNIYACNEQNIFVKVKGLYIEAAHNGGFDYNVSITEERTLRFRNSNFFRTSGIHLDQLLNVIKYIRTRDGDDIKYFDKTCFLLLNYKFNLICGLESALMSMDHE
jgi:hypothetical protein